MRPRFNSYLALEIINKPICIQHLTLLCHFILHYKYLNNPTSVLYSMKAHMIKQIRASFLRLEYVTILHCDVSYQRNPKKQREQVPLNRLQHVSQDHPFRVFSSVQSFGNPCFFFNGRPTDFVQSATMRIGWIHFHVNPFAITYLNKTAGMQIEIIDQDYHWLNDETRKPLAVHCFRI